MCSAAARFASSDGVRLGYSATSTSCAACAAAAVWDAYGATGSLAPYGSKRRLIALTASAIARCIIAKTRVGCAVGCGASAVRRIEWRIRFHKMT